MTLTSNGSGGDKASPSRKRTLPAHERGDHVVKRRSSRACRSCRSRKVRCDVAVSGSPCTNCRLDNVDCVLIACRRGSKAVRITTEIQHHGALPTPSPSSTREMQCLAAPTSIGRGDDDDGTPPTRATEIQDLPVCLTFDEQDDCHSSIASANESCAPAHPHHNVLAWANSDPRNYHQDILAPPGLRPSSSKYDVVLPSFVKRFPTSVTASAIAFLEQEGALIVPEPDICEEILRSYISNIHPTMPLLDLRRLLSPFTSEDGGRPISLLLFQAVMFAGLASVHPQVIRRMSFETTKQGREVFFARVRLLYDFDVEPDDITVVQSLILMSLWYGGREDRKNTWHWTGLALSLAQNLGLHREPGLSDGSEDERRLRRRLWWSLYIRDRLIALGTRRPMRIKEDDYELSMLSAQDFERGLSEGASARYLDGGFSGDGSDHTDACLRHMCISLAELCICIGHVLSAHYTTLGPRSGLTKSLMVVPKRYAEQALELERCDEELNQWHRSLHPEVVRLADNSANGPAFSHAQRQCAVLKMLHLTVISLLYRPHVLQAFSSAVNATELQNQSRTKVKAAARKLTRVFHSMLQHDQVRFLPTSGIPTVLSAAMSNMLDMRSDDEDVQDAANFRFNQSLQVLQRLREIYASADCAISFLASVARKAGIDALARVFATQTGGIGSAPLITIQQPASLAPEDQAQTTSRVPGQNLSRSHASGHTTYAGHGHLSQLPQVVPGVNREQRLQPPSIQRPGSTRGHTNIQADARTIVTKASFPVFGTTLDGSLSNKPTAYPASIVSNAGTTPIVDELCEQQQQQQTMMADDIFYTSLGSLDYDMDPDAIAGDLDFCSGGFGLWDGLSRDQSDADAIGVDSYLR